MRRPVDRLEPRIALTVAGPTRDPVGKRITVTAWVLVDSDVSTITNATPAVRRDRCIDGCIEDRATNGDGDTVLAGIIVVLVSGARTVGWNAVDDADQVSVLARVVVAAVGHEDGVAGELELEGFVLGTFADTIRERQSREGMIL